MFHNYANIVELIEVFCNSCNSLQEPPERSVPIHATWEMWTQEITETRNGRTSVHRVGPLAGLSAVMLRGAVVAFIITVVAMATPSWIAGGGTSQGLWKICHGSICVELPASYLQGKHH